MRDLLNLIRWMFLGLFRSRTWLEAENLALRHQLNVLHRRSPNQPCCGNFDRLIFVCLYRVAPRILDAVSIVEPETVIRWHRAGLRSLWRWKSRRRAGRPQVSFEVRRLIRDMTSPIRSGALLAYTESCSSSELTLAKPRWQVHGAAKATSLARLENVPPELRRRDHLDRPVRGSDDLLSAAIRVAGPATRSKAHPVARRHCASDCRMDRRQVTEACAWENAPQYLIRDRDRVYGEAFTRRIRAMGIRDRATAPRSPWQNGCAERLIGSIRRECLDHVIVFGERHLRHVLRSYAEYYNEARTYFPWRRTLL